MLVVRPLRSKVYQDHKQGRIRKLKVWALKLINNFINHEPAISVKLAIRSQRDNQNCWPKRTQVFILDIDPHLYHKSGHVCTFLGWSKWIAPNKIPALWIRCRWSHHVHILFCSFIKYPVRNVGRQNWNEKVHFHFWSFLILGSSAHPFFCNLGNPEFLYLSGLLNVRTWTEYLCKLCAFKCLNDYKKENFGNCIWYNSDDGKRGIVFLSLDIRYVGWRWIAVQWGIH